MDLQNALTSLQQVSIPVTAFVVDQSYPLLFFADLLNQQRQKDASVVSLDMRSSDQEIKAQLETSFLGQSKTYWLGALSQVPKKKAQDWCAYFQHYQGPNRILFAVTNDFFAPYKKKAGVITPVWIPDKITRPLFLQLFSHLVRDPRPMDKRYIDQLFTNTDKIDLDVACVLMHYLQVIGSKAQEFFTQWLDKLVIPETSLFKLSQYFFARQRSTFFKLWYRMHDEYPEQFWISFWSEQVWRAAFYCQAMEQRDIANAKKVGYRLPFSFLQKEYKTHNMQHLLKAHQWLYDLDYSLKNSGDAIGLDLFFLRFFSLE